MLKVFNERVYGLDESIVAGGYPMRSDEITEWTEDDLNLTEKDYNRATKLGTVPTGTGHDNFLKGVIVQFDVRYPNYWTPQFQRYSFHDIISSNSKMHRLTKMDIKECCNEYVDDIVILNLQEWVDVYNAMTEKKAKTVIEVYRCDAGEYHYYYGDQIDEVRKKYHPSKIGYIKEFTKYEVFMKVISNCPMGFEQTMRITSNYLQLKTIYLQRKHHKLKEDWGNFCEWCESLPHFKEFCLKK